jgi:iron-regulated transporter 1
MDHSLLKLLSNAPLIFMVCVFFMQWTCLLVCVGSIWVKNSVLAAYMLMAGVATSRLGLWMFDLSVLQQMQVAKTQQ